MNNNDYNIPVYRPSISGNEKQYVNECLDSSWISSKGDFVTRFEKNFSDFLNIKSSTTVSNGTVALHLALHALKIGPGDEVIVPTLTYIATVNAILYTGATPVFVDSLEDSWNIDYNQIESKITPKTKALLIVHLYGNPCAMDQIMEICDHHNLHLIEDMAEAFGATYNNNFVGGFGDLATFSFFGNKTITTGEGGMLSSNNTELIEYAAYLKSQSVSPVKEYWHDEIGFNFRMTNICAAIGVAQLENVNDILYKKQQINKWYQNNLQDTDLEFQFVDKSAVSSYWMVTLLAENSSMRDTIRTYLKKKGVDTRPMFYPAHTLPIFHIDKSFPIAESLSKKGISLPSYPDLGEEDIFNICRLIKLAIVER